MQPPSKELLDRARKICDCFGLVDEPDYDTDCLIGDGFNEPCAIHYRIARALEEYGRETYSRLKVLAIRHASEHPCTCDPPDNRLEEEIRNTP